MKNVREPKDWRLDLDQLDGPILDLLRSLTGTQRLGLSAWITDNTRAEMRHQLRIDHPDWEDWQISRALAYWSYGDAEMSKVPEHVWRDAWLARKRREG